VWPHKPPPLTPVQPPSPPYMLCLRLTQRGVQPRRRGRVRKPDPYDPQRLVGARFSCPRQNFLSVNQGHCTFATVRTKVGARSLFGPVRGWVAPKCQCTHCLSPSLIHRQIGLWMNIGGLFLAGQLTRQHQVSHGIANDTGRHQRGDIANVIGGRHFNQF